MNKIGSAALFALLFTTSVQATTITILPGDGFADSTAVTPVGGNAATTLGQARLNLFQRAATLWAQKIVSSQPIYVSVDFYDLSCSPNQALLGQAAANAFFKNFPNAPRLNVYYPAALANALAQKRIDRSVPTIANRSATADVIAEFNSTIDDGGTSCLNGKGFYYGLDNNPGNKIDLLNTVMHEMGHGLGFTSLVDEVTGQGADTSNPNQLGIYDQFVYDETATSFWPQMTTSMRVMSAINDGKLVWNGAAVNSAASRLSAGVTAAGHLQLYAPNPGQPGSSVSHWSNAASPHLLMEPFDAPALKAAAGVDFTACAFADMGWQLGPAVSCPDGVLVNHPPVANTQTLRTFLGINLSLTLTASDADGDPLNYSVVTMPKNGLLIGTPPLVIYVPNLNFTGADSFQFVANDGKVNSATATIGINVAKTNTAPVAVAQNVSVIHEHAVLIVLSGTDVDADALTFSVVKGVSHGTLTGTLPRLVYRPEAGYVGPDSFTFKANDGIANSAATTVSIVVTNQVPVAVTQSVQVTRNTERTVTLSATDADGDALTFSIATSPAHGTLTGTPPNIVYSPATGYTGTDSFTFRVNDGAASASASINITVSGNHAPVANAQSTQTAQDVTKAVVLTASDVDGDALSYRVEQPLHGVLSGTAPNLSYTPTSGYSGADSFTFKVNDGFTDSNSATVSITVTAPATVAEQSGGGGGAMPNLLWLLILVGLRQLRALRGSMLRVPCR
ncbi:Ig-like domain-containing protein [Stenotrophobium rhamnosiphilum]|uniref:Tandem-95 repeat protein n=1 Tax=Stenotrophobium rhamnosiphilum TaxID=2029166 RepID=A0A2T5MDT2_9GAMM|nr:Ig-like domain-containing protein [Stenotrophobium rhamnosiphilum]PTU30748.1 hypothetical protein CJD38_14775 [Stenotrophobium rhamnosiphilum]